MRFKTSLYFWHDLQTALVTLLFAGTWVTSLPGQAPCTYPCDYQEAGPVNYCSYPSTGCPPDYHPVNGCCCYDYSPIIIDIAGDGIELSAPEDGVYFDITATGSLKSIARTLWATDDAWLVLDRNNNGNIDDGKELFGNRMDQPPSSEPNGFRALAVWDTAAKGGNGDGTIDGRDAVFASLHLWQDRNHNAKSEPDELLTLSAAAITEIDFKYKSSRRSDRYGNLFRYRAKVSDTRPGRVGRWAWDVFLKVVPPNVGVSRATNPQED